MKKATNAATDQNFRYSNYKSFDVNKYYITKAYDLIKKLKEKRNIREVLDVGCADGSFGKKMKNELGFDVYGIDISKNAVKLANQKGIHAKVHDLSEELPFDNKKFDLVVACEIIEHLYDTDFFISEIKRVLKKKGVLVLTTPNLASLVNRIKILFGKYPNFVPEYKVGGAGHVRAYTMPVLTKQLNEHGFNVLIKTSPNMTFPMVNKYVPLFLKKLAIKMGDILPNLGSHIILVAENKD